MELYTEKNERQEKIERPPLFNVGMTDMLVNFNKIYVLNMNS